MKVFHLNYVFFNFTSKFISAIDLSESCQSNYIDDCTITCKDPYKQVGCDNGVCACVNMLRKFI